MIGMIGDKQKNKKQGPSYDIEKCLIKDQNYSDYYSFYGVLKPNKKSIEIYLYYFPNCLKISKNNKKQLSDFFLIFIKIFFMKSLISSSQTMTDLVKANLNDFIEKDKIYYKDYELYEQLKKLFDQFDKQFRKLSIKNNQKQNHYDLAYKIFVQIDKLIKEFQKTKLNKQQIKNILQNEQLPQEILKWTQIQIIKHIIDTFKSFRNFKFLSAPLRKQAERHLIQKNSNINIFKLQKNPNFKDINNKSNDEKQQNYFNLQIINQRNSRQSLNKADQLYVLCKFQTRSNSQIITKIQNYLIDTSMDNVKFLHHSSRPKLIENIIKDIIQQSTNYYSKTKSFYPSISLSDIYFNQKKLRGFISEEKLILDAVGFSEDIFNVQMKLIYGMTPNIESQKCYLEYYTTAQIILNRICYIQRQQKKNQKNQHEIYGKQVRKKEIDNNLKENYEEQQEKIILRQYKHNVRELNETVHVWRLINIFYYILKLQKLNMHLYNTYDEEGDLQVNLSKPFYIEKYKKVLKKSYQMMEKREISVPRLLSYEQQDQEEENEWKFNMKSLRNIQDFKQIDSMMEPLQFVRIKAQFYMRFIIIKQFTSLLSHKCFKRLTNPIKQILTLLINTMEYFYQVKIVIQQSQKRKHSRSQIIASFDDLYKDIKLDYKSFKQTALNIQKNLSYNQNQKKIYPYPSLQQQQQQSNLFRLQRRPYQYRLYPFFISINKAIYQGAIQNIKMVQKLHDELQSIEINILNNTNIIYEKQIQQFQIKQKQYLQKTKILFNICTEKYKDSVQRILTFLQKEIQSISIEQFCKNDKNISKGYFAIMLKKIILSVKVLLILNESNWKQFQIHYQHFLIENQKTNSKKNSKTPDLNKEEIQQYEKSFGLIDKFIKRQHKVKEPSHKLNQIQIQKPIQNELSSLKKQQEALKLMMKRLQNNSYNE